MVETVVRRRRKADSSAQAPQEDVQGDSRMVTTADSLQGAREASTALTILTPTRVRRPGKLTPEVIDAICARVADGAPIRHACYLEGVTDEALRIRRRDDEDVDFMVQQARATAVERMRTEFWELLRDDKRGAMVLMQWMERADPDNFAAPKQRVALEGANGGPVEIAAGRVPQSEGEALARLDALRTRLVAAGEGE